MTTALIIIALICFALAAVGRTQIWILQLTPLGLFCWLLAVSHEQLTAAAGGNLITVLIVILLVVLIVYVVNRLAPQT